MVPHDQVVKWRWKRFHRWMNSCSLNNILQHPESSFWIENNFRMSLATFHKDRMGRNGRIERLDNMDGKPSDSSSDTMQANRSVILTPTSLFSDSFKLHSSLFSQRVPLCSAFLFPSRFKYGPRIRLALSL